jgi:hypothetical protein
VLSVETKGNKYVNYGLLLDDDEFGDRGKFCEVLRAQFVTEYVSFVNNLVECIAKFTEGEAESAVSQIREGTLQKQHTHMEHTSAPTI